MAKIIGKRKKLTIAERIHKMEKLNNELMQLRPYRKPKGMILKFKTYEELYQFALTRAAKKI